VAIKLPKLKQSELKEWLDQLSYSHEGIIKLINLFLAQAHKFVEQKILCSFICDCISLGAKTAYDTLVHYDVVCRRNDTYFALCRVDHSPLSGSTSAIATTMDSITFHKYIVKRPKTIIKSTLLDKPKSHDATDEKIYRDALAKMTSGKGWPRNNATLGKPFPDPKHVWFTDASHIEAEIKTHANTDTDATKVRDALGLITTKGDTYLLSLQFPSNVLCSISNLRMARPGFADLGNKRYVLYLNKHAENVYRNNWGLTVHLRKLRRVPPEFINGVPERICSPIPLSVVETSLEVKPLGWVVSNRGEEIGIDDDNAFIKRLLGRRNLTAIKQQLIRKNAHKP